MHHDELAMPTRRGRFAPDALMAQRMDDAGVLLIVSGRDIASNTLLGYCIWYLSTDLESAGLPVATQGPWFVDPAQGGSLGTKLFLRSLDELRVLGVLNAFPHRWAMSDPRLDTFFARLGAEPLEFVFSIWLGD